MYHDSVNKHRRNIHIYFDDISIYIILIKFLFLLIFIRDGQRKKNYKIRLYWNSNIKTSYIRYGNGGTASSILG